MSFGCDLRLGSLTSPDRFLVVQIVKIKTSFVTVSYFQWEAVDNLPQ